MSTVGSSTVGMKVPSGLANASKLSSSVQQYGNSVDQQYVDTFGKITFPASYTAFTGREAEIQDIRKQIRSGAKLTYNVGDQDISNVLKIREAYRKYLYDKHFAKILYYSKDDPASLDKWRNLYPDFFRIRLEYVTQVAKLQARIAALKLNGVQTREDLDFVISSNLLSREEKQSLTKLLSTPVNELDTLDLAGQDYPVLVPDPRDIGANLESTGAKLEWGDGGLLKFKGNDTTGTNNVMNLGVGVDFPHTYTKDSVPGFATTAPQTRFGLVGGIDYATLLGRPVTQRHVGVRKGT